MARIPRWQQEARSAFRQKLPRRKDELSPDMYVFSFTAAGVEEESVLGGLQELIQGAIDSGEDYAAQGYDDFIRKATDLLEQSSGAKSPLTHARLKLIYQTNVRQAYGLAQWRIGVDKWHITRFPAWRFVRTPGAKVKRYAHTYTENWVRLKLDFHFWATLMNARSLGGFEVPYAPFGFNSYMILEPVSRADAIAAGISPEAIDRQSEQDVKRGRFGYLLPEDWRASHSRITRTNSRARKGEGRKARRRRLQRKAERLRREMERQGITNFRIEIRDGEVVIVWL